jgi:hypothetical protein
MQASPSGPPPEILVALERNIRVGPWVVFAGRESNPGPWGIVHTEPIGGDVTVSGAILIAGCQQGRPQVWIIAQHPPGDLRTTVAIDEVPPEPVTWQLSEARVYAYGRDTSAFAARLRAASVLSVRLEAPIRGLLRFRIGGPDEWLPWVLRRC